MEYEDIAKIVLTILLSFGGGAVIVFALSNWLGSLWASRILQNESHEQSLVRSSYEHYLDLILAYFKVLYAHYRLCQRATVDAYRQPDGTIIDSREEFLGRLEASLIEWRVREGEIRLLLPSAILATHERFISAFNKFKDSIEAYDTSTAAREARAAAFRDLDSVKNELEAELRRFLRTEKLLK